ncbi:MAG: hypothetical protein JNM39_14035 [Bdellovibrionaceae bacterium]|nr:hypothetical protein [Pseudobdellovibrionaceae bacterium]
MLFFQGFSNPNERRNKRTAGLHLTAVATIFAVGFTVLSIGFQANAKCKAGHAHSQSSPLTPEQRETMAIALEKKAKCLRTPEKSANDCHEEMKASCEGGKTCGANQAGGSGKCPMMEETK